MKFSTLIYFPAAVSAFQPTAFRSAHSRRIGPIQPLQATTRPDSTAAVAAALDATKKYGATSPEARVAWDAVEEMDSSDNSAAAAGSLDTECLIEEEISKACSEYGDKLDSLYELLQENKPKLDMMKSLVTDLQAIKLTVGTKGVAAPDSPALQKALKEAKDMEAKFGPGSREAAVAWTELEEIASAGLGNSMGPRLDEECLVETAVEACQALDELNRALNLQKSGSGMNS